MPLYTCEYCNISTNIVTHYKRHLKTNKHLYNQVKYGDKKNICENEHKMSKNEQKVSFFHHKMSKNEHKMSKKYICEHCGNSFTTHANMMRHINHYCKVVKNEHVEKEDLKKIIK